MTTPSFCRTTVNLGVISNTYLDEMMTADPDVKATVTLAVFMHWEDHEYHEDDATLSVTVMAEWGHAGTWSNTIDYVTELDTDPALDSVSRRERDRERGRYGGGEKGGAKEGREKGEVRGERKKRGEVRRGKERGAEQLSSGHILFDR